MGDLKFDFDDIILVPESISNVSSRKECCVFDSNGMLPLFTAPMDMVVNEDNFQTFVDQKIYTVLPRGGGASQGFASTNKFKWLSYGLNEFENMFIEDEVGLGCDDEHFYVLIDIANGNMKRLITLIEKAKKKYKDEMVLMVGNVANPYTFFHLSKAGADYIRCGIGGGQNCTTSANVAIGYPLGSLISEISCLKKERNLSAKIVADGGMKNYSDIIKALALGADFCMIGSLFNKALESASPNYEVTTTGNYQLLNEGINPNELFGKQTIYKKCRGMSTKEVQKEWGKETLTTSEGIVRYNRVEYTLEQWVNNFRDYLASAMSYTNSTSLKSFVGDVKYVQITNNAFNRFNK